MKELKMQKLETDRLILREFTIEDANDMYNNWASDKETSKFLDWDVHESVDATKNIIKSWIDEYKSGSLNWVVELKDTKEIIGSITVVHLYKKDLNAEIGYCYGSKYWEKGYATEALKRVINFLLNDCEMHLVEARHISGNPASGRVMQKAGMIKEATLKDRKINKYTKELNDIIVYSITKSDIK